MKFFHFFSHVDQLLAQDINMRETVSFVFPRNVSLFNSIYNLPVLLPWTKEILSLIHHVKYLKYVTCKLSDLKTK